MQINISLVVESTSVPKPPSPKKNKPARPRVVVKEALPSGARRRAPRRSYTRAVAAGAAVRQAALELRLSPGKPAEPRASAAAYSPSSGDSSRIRTQVRGAAP